jgi:NitT/TauT family transport system ATP-binding protein
MSAPILLAQELSLAYAPSSGAAAGQRRVVLDGLSLAVAAGELVAVLGPSGAGKSSLLRVLAGVQPPDAGRVCVAGEPLAGPHPRVALAFQDACLLPWLSVEQNVAFGLSFARQPKLERAARDERITAALAEVGLAHARALRPAQLSGGMAQRVALARALARKPQILLLDEPFGALDEVTRADMQQLLTRVVDDTHAATVLVTHDIDEALLVADRVELLGAHGQLVRTWHVTLPRPRTDCVRELGALRIEILQTLHDALAVAPQAPVSLSSTLA